MRKLLQIVALLTITFSAASAHLIHSLHIGGGGERGFKEIGEYEGLFIKRQWCLGAGTIKCPYPCGGAIIPVPINEGTVGANADLAEYEKTFIKEAMIQANSSLVETGLITQVYSANGEQRVLTAKFTKSNNGLFYFDVVNNKTYEENLIELSSL